MFACNPDSDHRIYLQLIALIWVTATLANPIDSTAIAPGVVFDTYRFTTPNDVFVLSIERNRPEYEFRVAWPGEIETSPHEPRRPQSSPRPSRKV
jgi:hypothetical protein